MNDFAIILTTFPADRDHVPFASALVEERLAACVNILPPMSSVYRWEGAVERADERQLVMKTTAGKVDALLRRVAELHPYDVPELLVIPVLGASAAYGTWLTESTTEPG